MTVDFPPSGDGNQSQEPQTGSSYGASGSSASASHNLTAPEQNNVLYSISSHQQAGYPATAEIIAAHTGLDSNRVQLSLNKQQRQLPPLPGHKYPLYYPSSLL
jgi:hypothetical protein